MVIEMKMSMQIYKSKQKRILVAIVGLGLRLGDDELEETRW